MKMVVLTFLMALCLCPAYGKNHNLEAQAMAIFEDYYDLSQDCVPFCDLISLKGGGTPKTTTSEYWNGDVLFFTPKDVGSPYTISTEKTITAFGLKNCNSILYPLRTVFVTARGTVGKVALAGRQMAMNQSCYALLGKGIDQILVYFYTLKTIKSLQHKASGAVFDAITTKDFESEKILKLSNENAKKFLSIASPIFDKILENTLENERLVQLRDKLLPKLMSGEIDVSEVEI